MDGTNPASQVVREVVTAVSTLDPFPVLPFMQRLYNKARMTPSAATFREQLPIETQYGPDDGFLLDNVDATARFQTLAVECIVNALSSLDNNTDKPDFRACVQGVSIADYLH
jgi:hypothetical protein